MKSARCLASWARWATRSTFSLKVPYSRPVPSYNAVRLMIRICASIVTCCVLPPWLCFPSGASADEADEKRWEAEVKAAEAGASGNDIHKRSSWQKTFCETFGIEMDDGTDHSLYMKLWFKIFDKFK